MCLSALGLLAARAPVARLHFLTPVTSIAGPLVGLAWVVGQGVGLTGGLVLLTVGLLAVTGAPLGAAIARVTEHSGDSAADGGAP